MQNREEFRQKGRDGSMGVEKLRVARGGKNFQKGGGGINIVFRPKYRPLH
jgi:hypothetical protein